MKKMKPVPSAEEIMQSIQNSIVNWHRDSLQREEGYEIVTEEIRKVRTFGVHRDDLNVVVRELTSTNTEMWHEEDKVRGTNAQKVVRAVRNLNPLNQHRNDLIEEIDEIMVDHSKR